MIGKHVELIMIIILRKLNNYPFKPTWKCHRGKKFNAVKNELHFLKGDFRKKYDSEI